LRRFGKQGGRLEQAVHGPQQLDDLLRRRAFQGAGHPHAQHFCQAVQPLTTRLLKLTMRAVCVGPCSVCGKLRN